MLSTICRENLKAIVQAYGKATGRDMPKISKEFYGNSEFMSAFFSGETSMSFGKYDAILDKFRKQWPEEAKWPFLRAIVIKGPVKKSGISLPRSTKSEPNQLSNHDAAAAGKRRSGVRADPA